ncbi:unnamed protein product [Cuscuta campestris]|uniref:Cullin family profile domain-containing protein n=1 Tax=Cuscuta campestris TaxID=132261 RepID=A0A484L170_9ASTE|nr:unnamed protein product [Cuscuta campestris]
MTLVKQAEDGASHKKADKKHVRMHEQALKKAFENFFNKGVAGSSTPELLATFCDIILNKEGSEKLSDEVTEETLEKAVELLAYISDKDLFAELYRRKLARRLLFDKRTNYEHQRSILTKLKGKYGYLFTSKMEGMLSDLTLSKENQTDFEEYLSENPVAKPGIDLTVTVLNAFLWPRCKSFNLNLPPEMVKCVEVFSDFYQRKTRNRKLTWIDSLGTCNMSGHFEQKTIELIVTTSQACTLLLFNTSNRLSYQEIVGQLNLSDKAVVKLLHSLSCAKYKILKKEPSTEAILPSDMFEFNSQFTDKMSTIKVRAVFAFIFALDDDGLTHFLTYPDNNAVGYLLCQTGQDVNTRRSGDVTSSEGFVGDPTSAVTNKQLVIFQNEAAPNYSLSTSQIEEFPPLPRKILSPFAPTFVPAVYSYADIFIKDQGFKATTEPEEDPFTNLNGQSLVLSLNAVEDHTKDREGPILYTHSDGEDFVFIDTKLKPLQIDFSRCSKHPLHLRKVTYRYELELSLASDSVLASLANKMLMWISSSRKTELGVEQGPMILYHGEHIGWQYLTLLFPLLLMAAKDGVGAKLAFCPDESYLTLRKGSPEVVSCLESMLDSFYRRFVGLRPRAAGSATGSGAGVGLVTMGTALAGAAGFRIDSLGSFLRNAADLPSAAAITGTLPRHTAERNAAASGRRSKVSMASEDAMDEIPLSKRLEKKGEVEVASKTVMQEGRINAYCNQPTVKFPMCYINLVDDIDEFDNFPWGDDVWSDLVDHVHRCGLSIEKGGTSRPTFGGYMFALQIWAFETFPSLAKAGMCMLFLSAKRKKKLSLHDAKRACQEKKTDKRSEDAVLMKDSGNMSTKQGGDDEVGMVGLGSLSGNDMAYGSKGEKEERNKKQCGEHKELLKVMLEIMAKQAEQDKKIDKILVILQEKAISSQNETHTVKDSMMAENEQLKPENDDVRKSLENDQEIMINPEGPSFEILTPIAKDGVANDGNKDNGSGSVLVVEGSRAENCFKPSEISWGDTQFSPHDLEVIDKVTGMWAKSSERCETVIY